MILAGLSNVSASLCKGVDRYWHDCNEGGQGYVVVGYHYDDYHDNSRYERDDYYYHRAWSDDDYYRKRQKSRVYEYDDHDDYHRDYKSNERVVSNSYNTNSFNTYSYEYNYGDDSNSYSSSRTYDRSGVVDYSWDDNLKRDFNYIKGSMLSSGSGSYSSGSRGGYSGYNDYEDDPIYNWRYDGNDPRENYARSHSQGFSNPTYSGGDSFDGDTILLNKPRSYMYSSDSVSGYHSYGGGFNNPTAYGGYGYGYGGYYGYPRSYMYSGGYYYW